MSYFQYITLKLQVEITPWSMFLTPLALKIRFNTMFYMTFLQPGTDLTLCKQVYITGIALDSGVKGILLPNEIL